MIINKPTESDLKPFLDEATKNKPIADWIPKFLKNLRKLLLENPQYYRGYGPYWWALKKELVNAGFLDFGDEIDMEWLAAVDYERTEYNLLAGFAYLESMFDLGKQAEPVHTIDLENGETIEFLATDSDMDIIIFEKTHG